MEYFLEPFEKGLNDSLNEKKGELTHELYKKNINIIQFINMFRFFFRMCIEIFVIK